MKTKNTLFTLLAAVLATLLLAGTLLTAQAQQSVTPVPSGPIPVSTLEQLNAIRYDLDTDGRADRDADSTAYKAVFPNLSANNTYTGYALTKNLDFQDNNSYADTTANKSKWTMGNGWDPVANNLPFAGTFDGRGHTIFNLYINRPTELSVGLFDRVGGAKATIKSVGILNPKVNAKGGSALIASLYSGTIDSCHVSGGTVTGGDNNEVGGLVGTQSGGTISNCYVTAVNVTGIDNSRVGGLVGSQTRGMISNCYASEGTTKVRNSTNGPRSSYVGGLVGTSSSAISTCYTSGWTNIGGDGGIVAGGLVGSLSDNTVADATISACYVTGGSIIGGKGSYVGGLVGVQNSETEITACYVFLSNIIANNFVGGLFGIQSSGGTVTACYAGGTDYTFLIGNANPGTINNSYYQTASSSTQGRTASQLRMPTTYTEIYTKWDVDINGDDTPDNPWNFGTASQYPVLNVDFNNDGSKADDVTRQLAFAQPKPIPVTTLEQLNAIRYDLNSDGNVDHKGDKTDLQAAFLAYNAAFADLSGGSAYAGYVLTKDLDFKKEASYEKPNANKSSWTTGEGWMPIGNEIFYPFMGTFDGGGYTITNLYIKRTVEGRGVGLFGRLEGGTIKNVGLVSPNTIGGNNHTVGSLVGSASGMISNCYSQGGTTKVENSVNGGVGSVGGLVGIQQGLGKTTACYVAQGNIVVGDNANGGGLVGLNSGEITTCYVQGGSITSTGTPRNIGGLVGRDGGQSSRMITACYVFEMSVSTHSLVGLLTGSTITASYAGGKNYTSLRGLFSGTVANSYHQAATASTLGRTAAQLRTPTAYGTTGIYKDWNLDLDGDNTLDNPWNFGTATQYPVLNVDFNNDGSKADDVTRQQLFTADPSLPHFIGKTIEPQDYSEERTITNLTLPEATNGDGPFTYTITPDLPDGLSFNAATREITGTPEVGTKQDATVYTYKVTDNDSDVATLQFTIVITEDRMPDFTGKAVAPQFYLAGRPITILTLPAAASGDGTITYTMKTALPDGLTFDADARTISGKSPTAAAATEYTLVATDEDGDEAELTFTITTTAAALMLSAQTLTVTASSTVDSVITFTSNVAWEAAESVDWINAVTPAAGTGTNTPQQVKLTYNANTAETARTGTVTFTETTAGVTSPLTTTLTVTQNKYVPDGPIEINTLEQLHAIRYDLTGDGQVDHVGDQRDLTAADSAYAAVFPDIEYETARPNKYTGYKLMRDLNFRNDASYSNPTANKVAYGGDGTGTGWLPVGPIWGSDGNPFNEDSFSGTFDGGGHTIDSLYINRTTGVASLFGGVHVNGIIKNVGIVDATITGPLYAAGLVSVNNGGTITGACYVKGSTIEGTTANGAVGGIQPFWYTFRSFRSFNGYIYTDKNCCWYNYRRVLCERIHY